MRIEVKRGQACRLEAAVRTNGAAGYIALAPLQALTPV